MCKHVAATLYGVGVRLDHEPELLFTLRGVDPAEMVEAAIDRPVTASRSRRGRVLESDELSSVFGVDIVDHLDVAPTRKRAAPGKGRKARGKSAARKTPAKGSKKKSAGRGSTKRVGAKKAATKRAGVKKAAARKSATKKAHAKKASTKKTSAKRRP
jgi:uncharacterized Zn finger protein